MKKFLLTFLAVLVVGIFASAQKTVEYVYGSQGFSDQTTLTEVTIKDVTVSYDSGGVSNVPKYYTSGSAGRIYEKNSITFSVAEGYEITKIEFTTSNNKFTATVTGGGTYSAPTTSSATWDGKASTVTLTKSGKVTYIKSWTVTYVQTSSVAAPEVTCENNLVNITAPDAEAIYYTLDGTAPGTEVSGSTLKYEDPFKITKNTTIKAIAVVGGESSPVTTFDAQYVSNVATPTITCENNTVTITAEGADAIYYTTDGTTDPTTSSTRYTGPFTIDKETIVKAIAVVGEEVSNIAEEVCTYIDPNATEVSYVYSEHYSANKVLTDVTTECRPVKVTYGGSGTAIQYYDNGTAVRFYTKNTITFTIAEGYTITGIDFAMAGTYKFGASDEANVGTFDIKTAKWTGDNQSVTITNGTATTRFTGWTVHFAKLSNVKSPEIACVDNKVTITAEGADAIYYTTDGTNPGTEVGGSTKLYTEEGFTITKGITVIKAIAVVKGEASRVASLDVVYVSPVANPVITCTDNKVTITAADGAAIYYTTDGTTEPTTASTKYEGAFDITKTTTVKAMAVVGTDESNVETFTAEYIYTDYADLIAKSGGAEGTVKGPITAIYKYDKNLYTVDAAGNYMMLYDNKSNFGEVVNGDQFASVTGSYYVYNKYTPEIQHVTLSEKTTGTAIEPEVISTLELTKEMLYKYVKIEDVYITPSGSDAKKFDMMAPDESMGVIYNTFELANIPDALGLNVTGIVTADATDGTLYISPILIEHASWVSTPTFSEEGRVAAGSTIYITTATENATIYYTTDGTDPGTVVNESTKQYSEEGITINGNVTIKAIAVADGMHESEIATATYTTFDPDVTSATFNFADPGSLNPAMETPAESDGTDLTEKTLESNAVKIIFSGKEGQNEAPRIFQNSKKVIDLRLYDKQYFTISVAEGYILDKIVFKGEDLNPLKCDMGTYANGTWQITEKDIVIATKEQIRTGNVKFTSSGKPRISDITVTYKEGTRTGVDDIAVDAEDAPAEYYNLQGVRVENPTPGLYIVRRGNTTTKELVR